MKKVNITSARKAYANGKQVWLLPCKLKDLGIDTETDFNIQVDDSGPFDEAIQAFITFACNSEVGHYPHYYINQ